MPGQKTAAIELEGNPTTGFGWVYTMSQQGVIREVSQVYTADKASKGMTGSGGKFVFTFEAIAPGETELFFSYLRPWEKDTPAQKTVIYKAKVDSSNVLKLTLE